MGNFKGEMAFADTVGAMEQDDKRKRLLLQKAV
jgi:hypothetical protein